VNTILSEGQQRNKEDYEAFALAEVAGRADALDNRSLPLKDFVSEIGQRGYLGLTIPQEYGGKGLPFLQAALLCEALAKQEPGLGFTFAAHTAVIELIIRYGTDTQKSRYLPLLARGDTVGTVAITERNAGTDALAAVTTAVPSGDKYIINGSKSWVVNGDIAGLMAVLAKDGDKAMLFLLEEGTKGVSLTGNKIKMGLRSASANDMELTNVELGEQNILGTAGDAAEQIAFASDISKVLIAASAVGLTAGALDIAAEHARTRTQFGQTISTFQGIQWKIADMSADGAAAQFLTYRAAWSKDESPSEFRRNAAMCKLLASKVARIHSGEAVQVLGSFGLDEDCKTERFYRDAKTMEIAGGTSEYQKILLVDELGI
jgi:alkylation response protein AidB-like acyl-CoA dehydrogenase